MQRQIDFLSDENLSTREQDVQDEIEFRELLPKQGFFHDYMRYTDRQESPGSYHFWVGATILASVLQRTVWISKGVYNVYPNLYVILVAPSGRCRKSRAISLGCELIDQFDWVNLMPDKTTPEALVQSLMVGSQNAAVAPGALGSQTVNLTPDSVGLLRNSELSVFLNKATYTSGMVALLTDLYDCPSSWKYITRNKKPVYLRNVSLSMVGGSTPEWLATELPPSVFEGGFMSRVIFVVKTWRDRSIPFPQDPLPNERIQLQQTLLTVRGAVTGKLMLTKPAINWYTQWYHQNSETSESVEYHLTGYYERKPDFILKVGMLLAAAELTRNISDVHLQTALNILEWTQRRMFKAFSQVDLSPSGQLQRKIIDYLELCGGTATRRDILRKFGGRLPQGLASLEQIEAVLQEAGLLKIEHQFASGDPKGRGRPSIVYHLDGGNEQA